MRIRQARKILHRWSDDPKGYRYSDSLGPGSRLVAIHTYYRRTRRRSKRPVRNAWIRQVERLTKKAGQRPWKVDIKVELGTLPTFKRIDDQPLDSLIVFAERFVTFAETDLGISLSPKPPV